MIRNYFDTVAGSMTGIIFRSDKTHNCRKLTTLMDIYEQGQYQANGMVIFLISKTNAMNTVTTSEIREVLGAVHYMPSVSIIMPFDPKMSPKTEITHALKLAADKVQREVAKNYPNELGRLVMQKLRRLITNLNFSTQKKYCDLRISCI